METTVTRDVRPTISYVEWAPVLAGAVLASALTFVLLAFGTAIGLSATSPWPNSGLSAKAIASLAVFWALIQQIGAFMAGGYVAGRMRSRWAETGEESDFRDGLHGGLVWAVSIIIGAALALSAAGALARTGTEVAGQFGAAIASSKDATAAITDAMLRPAALQAAGPQQPAAAPRTAPPSGSISDAQRAEVGRLLVASASSGTISPQDRAYLAQLVAQRSGLAQQEAERRVDEAVTAAREAADKARKAAIVTGLVTSLGLIIGFAAAWWAAVKGGNHRDNAVPPRFDFRRSTVRPGA